MTAEISVNGDDAPDVAVADLYDDTIYIFTGPVQPGTYYPELADHNIPLEEVYQMVFADVDGDGAPELVTGNQSFGEMDPEPGLIATFDLTDL